ncbi:Phospholipase/carboxylesterase/thioesterase [Paraphysoderma sedebokerense]|nr:Phospholipase/carboxylesterase/thioesterase [Paraphysoderma sedebokerense]
MSAKILDAVVHQAKSKHTATVIFCHGLGDSGHGWAPVGQMLAPSLPHVKWIFPHAPVQPVTLNMGFRMPSWYDIYSLSDRDGKEDEKGLKESVDKVLALVKKEVDSGIPSDRIVIGGFSQGAALSLLSMLTGDTKFAGVAALSGYLPMRNKAKELMKETNKSTPIFMGHGDADEVVQHKWGSLTADALKALGYSVEFHTYRGMPHSASDDELKDVLGFLKKIVP